MALSELSAAAVGAAAAPLQVRAGGWGLTQLLFGLVERTLGTLKARTRISDPKFASSLQACLVPPQVRCRAPLRGEADGDGEPLQSPPDATAESAAAAQRPADEAGGDADEAATSGEGAGAQQRQAAAQTGAAAARCSMERTSARSSRTGREAPEW